MAPLWEKIRLIGPDVLRDPVLVAGKRAMTQHHGPTLGLYAYLPGHFGFLTE